MSVKVRLRTLIRSEALKNLSVVLGLTLSFYIGLNRGNWRSKPYVYELCLTSGIRPLAISMGDCSDDLQAKGTISGFSIPGSFLPR
jgi:hypothetical protein